MNLSDIKPQTPDWFDDFTRGWLFYNLDAYPLQYTVSTDILAYQNRNAWERLSDTTRHMYIGEGQRHPDQSSNPGIIEILP